MDGSEARLDFGREARKGIPEIVFGQGKSDDQIVAIMRAFVERNGRALGSRLRPATLERLAAELRGARLTRGPRRAPPRSTRRAISARQRAGGSVC